MELNELIELLKKGENERVEFKKSFTNRIAEDICAFANSEGGTILLGISDRGEIFGASAKDAERVANLIHNLAPIPKIKIEEVKINGKRVIAIRVEKSKELVTLGSLAYVRIGSTNRALGLDELVTKYIEKMRIRFDELASTATEKDINFSYVKRFLRERERLRNIKARGNLKENAFKLKILVKRNSHVFASNAGILFFCDNPHKFIPGASSRVIIMNSKNEVVEESEFYGPIWKQIENVYSYAISKIRTFEIRTGTKRRKILLVPEWSLREAIINAFAHRNYAIPSDIRIFIYPEKIAIRNPGSFPPDFKIEEPEHIPKNPLLCEYLYSTGYIEKYGYGIQRIMEECKKHPFCEVEFKSTAYRVEVIFKKKKEKTIDETDRIILAMLKQNKTISEIAGKLSLSKPAVIKRIEKMKAAGLVKKIARGYYKVAE